MKLDTVFARYLLLYWDSPLPREVSRVSGKYGDLTDDCGAKDGDLRAIGALLVVIGELDEGDVAKLTEDVLGALEEHHDEFQIGDSFLERAFARAIQKLGCAEQAFRVLAKAASLEDERPAEMFTGLLNELKLLKVAAPTDEEWDQLKPKKKGRRKKK